MTQHTQMLYEQNIPYAYQCRLMLPLEFGTILTCGCLLTVQRLSCGGVGTTERGIWTEVISHIFTWTMERDLKSHDRWTRLPTGHLVTWSRNFSKTCVSKRLSFILCSLGYIRTLKQPPRIAFAHELLAYQVG